MGTNNVPTLLGYSYVNNNPLSGTDPTGHFFHKKVWNAISNAVQSVTNVVHSAGETVQRNLHQAGESVERTVEKAKDSQAARTVVAAVAAYYTAGWLGAEFGLTGQMFGGGINGYLQTGNSEGFLRGFVSGGIPQDLGFTDAYNTDRWASIGIGIGRDAARGYVVGGREGIVPGIGYGQFNNAVGHLVGFGSTLSKPEFKQGAFVYEGSWWSNKGAITLGNVISGPTDFSSRPDFAIYYAHERDHISNPVEQGLGALYAPAHMVDLAVGNTGRVLGQGTDWFLLEEHVQQYPYSTLPPWPQ